MATRRDASGDLLADRRFRYGQAAAADGDHATAADLFVQALERAPRWAAGWFALGEAHRGLGARDAAVAAFARAAAFDATGTLGAPLALAALGAAATPAGADPDHMRALFDDYANRFDAHLTGALAYRAPDLLAAALTGIAPDRRFGRVLDLGCGTGLMGAAIRDRADWLGGIDLSPAMVALARQRAIYDDLAVGDMVLALRKAAEPFDVVLAADVLVYVGDLAPIFGAVAQTLAADGMFACSLQRGDAGSGARVGADRRFTHSRDHLDERAAQAGFVVASCEEASTRQDAGLDVPGFVVVLARDADRGDSA